MKSYTYDLHTHSCLSPCGDNDNTPNNIAGMAKISGVDILALTDHNTCKNCPAFFKAAERLGIVPIAGMELTTSEDIHIVCIFERLSDALRFEDEIQKHRILIKNRTDIFGEQLILDEEDNKVAEEEYLLSCATDLSVEDVPLLVKQFSGICYPAHIDRDANGIICVLGTLPETPNFSIVELHDLSKKDEYTAKYALEDKIILTGSDAHYLESIGDSVGEILLECENGSADEIRHNFFKKLGGL